MASKLNIKNKEEVLNLIKTIELFREELKRAFGNMSQIMKEYRLLAKGLEILSASNKYLPKETDIQLIKNIQNIYERLDDVFQYISSLYENVATLYMSIFAMSYILVNNIDIKPKLLEEMKQLEDKITEYKVDKKYAEVLEYLDKKFKEMKKREDENVSRGIYG